MPTLKQQVIHRKATVPAFMAAVAQKKGTTIRPAGKGAMGTHKPPPPPSPAVHVVPAIGTVKTPSGPTKIPALLPSNVVNRSAVNQDRRIDIKQAIKAGGTARATVLKREVRMDRKRALAARAPIVQKNPPPPTINILHGKKQITSAFQLTRFTTPFQKNVNIRRLTGTY